MPGTRALDLRELKSLIEAKGIEETTDYLVECLENKILRPEDFSVKELAEAIVGEEWVRNLNPKSGRYADRPMLEASGDAVSFNHFSHITGQLFFNTIKENFDHEEFVFSKVVPTKPSDIMTMEKIGGISAVADEFSVVGEADEYPNFGVSEDYIEVAKKDKRGGIIPVTREAIRGDLTGKLLTNCRTLGKVLGLNKEKRIIDCVIDENAGAVSAALGGHRYFWKGTSYATYQASSPWDNVTGTGVALVDETDLEAAWLTLIGITDPFTGEPIVQRPTHLIVTPQNVMTANRIVKAIQVNTHAGGYPTSGNPIETRSPSALDSVGLANLQILSSQQLAARAATDTDWWLGAPGKAFAYFAIWDIETEEAPAQSEAAFRRDIVFEYKASEMGCAGTLEPRVMTECRA